MNPGIKILSILCFLIPLMAFSEDNPVTAPDFRLSSGDHQSISLSEIRDRIILCFYETKDTKDKNKDLKNSLEKCKDRLDKVSQKRLFVLAVADCSDAKWPFIGFWEAALVDMSREIGYTLYGDWDGRMREGYRFVKNEANFTVIDQKGMIRYQVSGKVNPDEIIKIEKLVLSLAESKVN